MTNPFDQPPQPDGGRSRDPSSTRRTSMYGFDWSSRSRPRMIAGIVMVVAGFVSIVVYGNENGPDLPGLLVVGIGLLVVGIVLVVWPER